MTTFDWGEGPNPGADLHAWESSWASIEEDAASDPDAALSQYAELVGRMLATSGYEVDDPVASAGDEPEVVVTYRAARETAERAELGSASRSEVEVAIDDLRDVMRAITGGLEPG